MWMSGHLYLAFYFVNPTIITLKKNFQVFYVGAINLVTIMENHHKVSPAEVYRVKKRIYKASDKLPFFTAVIFGIQVTSFDQVLVFWQICLNSQ